MDIVSYGLADEALEEVKKLRIELEAMNLDPAEIAAILATVTQANTNATNAINTADSALAQSTTALNRANEAKTTADGLVTQVATASGKADTALTKATSSETAANNASTVASRAETKADTALGRADSLEVEIQNVAANATGQSQTALNRANEAHLIASNVQAKYDLEIPKLKTDVAGVTGKADSAVTTANAAMDKATSVETALNNLPTVGEGEVTTDELLNQVLITDAKATTAKQTADSALDLVGGADTKAQAALDKTDLLEVTIATTSNTAEAALTAANDAVDTVNTVSAEVTTKANEALTAAAQANTKAGQALDVANSLGDSIDSSNTAAQQALITANEAKVIADGVSAGLDGAIADSTDALDLATQANTLASGADLKATQAESIAGEAKTIAAGVDGKATQAQVDAANALSSIQGAVDAANAASAKADGVDGKATQAQSDASAALTAATQAEATANGVDAKATEALSSSASAVTTAGTANTVAQAAMDIATNASLAASAADDKAEDALTKAQEAIDQFSTFGIKGAVQTRAELPDTGNNIDDIRLVREENTFFRFNGTEWVPVGIAEEEYQTIVNFIADYNAAVAPYASLKQRLDAMEGYNRTWEAATQADFDRGAYDGTKYSAGVVLDKRMQESVNIILEDVYQEWEESPPKLTLVPPLVGNSDKGYTVTASSVYSAPYQPYTAFDGTINRYGWTSSAGTSTGWLQIEFPEPMDISTYSVVARDDNTAVTENPKDWTVSAKVGGEWVVVGTETDQTGWVVTMRRFYKMTKAVKATGFRIDVTANNGHSWLSIGQLEITNPLIPLPTLLGTNGLLNKVYLSQDSLVDFEEIVNFTFGSNSRELYLGVRMRDPLNGYVLAFKGKVGQLEEGSRDVIELFRVVNGIYTKLTSLNYIFLEDVEYAMKISFIGNNVKVSRDGVVLINIVDATYTAGKLAVLKSTRSRTMETGIETYNKLIYLEVI